MSPALPHGILITLEGGEGSGKSSLAQALASRLRNVGYEVLVTREPAGTPLGETVMDLFRGDGAVGPEAELLLIEAARAQHVAEVIRPALERGEIVLCDRYTDSTIAYQGHGRGLPMDSVRAANEIATGGLSPHFTLLLDLPPDVGLGRKDGERAADRIGRETLDFHRRVREGYLAQAEREPERVKVVDASADPKSVTDAAWREVQGFLGRLQ